MYLLEAAQARRINRYGPLSWYYQGEWYKLDSGSTTEQLRVANMLWQENIKSVMYRYDDCSYDNLPGQTHESYVLDEKDLRMAWDSLDPVQVLKACNFYSYQSCEHPEWESSEAKAFIDALKREAVTVIPGYEECEWGSPKPRSERITRLV